MGQPVAPSDKTTISVLVRLSWSAMLLDYEPMLKAEISFADALKIFAA